MADDSCVCGCGCLFLILTVVLSVNFVVELKWFEHQMESTCLDYKGGSGDAVQEIRFDSRRRRATGKDERANCLISVDAVLHHSEEKLDGKYRLVEEFAKNVDEGTARSICNKNHVRNDNYGCYVQYDEDEIRLDRTGYPMIQLVAMCVCWVVWSLGCMFVCVFLVRDTVWDSVVQNASDVKQGIKAAVSSKVSPNCPEPEKIPYESLAEKTAVESIEAETNQQMETNKADELASWEAVGSFRKLIESDLCAELIPGLRVRVLWVGMWYPATAISFNKYLTPPKVQFKWDDSSLAVRGDPWLPISEPSGHAKIRLHEDATAQIAQRRIIQGVVGSSIFNGLTFDSLDADGNGTLSPEEVRAGLHRTLGIFLDDASLTALFNKLDIDKTGKINAKEFRVFLGSNFTQGSSSISKSFTKRFTKSSTALQSSE
eukprot:TRINITY_DN98791_c0_g1_i1.p1 TRINITY_DN98791_c0_g1~~TRINITY_DN98791_c0_g1_i1.p1  ORF type:complete len:430 (+),score=56.92 TRINITY_DN98791_c0_g1_i1:120-1409(+)